MMMRAVIVLTLYSLTFWLYLLVVCLAPAEALVSPVAYSRVVAQAEWIAYQTAQKATTTAAVAAAAEVASPASIAIRAVAGPVGWAALGVTAGIALYQTFYPATTLTAVQKAATPAGTSTVAGVPVTSPVVGTPGNCGAYQGQPVCSGSQDQQAQINLSCAGGTCGVIPSGWTGSPLVPCTGDANGCNTWTIVHTAGGPNPVQTSPGSGPTVQQITNYLTNLPASDPNSIESNSKPLGLGGPVPDTGTTTNTVPVSPTQMPTTVKPTSQVGPTDIVVNPSAPPPANQQQTMPTTQTSTTTTTTTTNPDGSVTQTKSTTASSSCTTASGHDQRTLGTVLQAHQATWNTSGLIGTVNLLKTLTWPSALPVVTVTTTMLGSFAVDFNQWAWAFTALRTLILAIASLAAYRIIFVGGR